MTHDPNSLIQEFLSVAGRLLESRDGIFQIIADSSQHDNGFMKIVLRQRATKVSGLRLHIWSGKTIDSNAHSHGWDMESLVLRGGYSAIEYIEEEGGSPYHRFDFWSNRFGNYTLSNMTPSSLKITRNYELRPGDYYFMEKGVIHRVESIPRSGAMTIVRTWTKPGSEGQVFSHSGVVNTFREEHRLDPEAMRMQVIEACRIAEEIR